MSLPQGEVIVREGDIGDRCFLIQEGEVEVIQKEKDGERRVALLEPGALFGEAALLTEAPRNATVRATKPTKLLSLARSDLLEVLSWNRRIGPTLFELLRLRDKPIRRKKITSQSYTTQDGEKIVTLRDPERGTYFRLSPLGWFIWERLDGHHNLKDLTLVTLQEFQSFAPHAIAEIVGGLVAAGFAEGQAVKVTKYLPSSPWVKRILTQMRGLFVWKLVMRKVDPFFEYLYHHLKLKYAYSKFGQSFMALIVIAGGIIFLKSIPLMATLPSYFGGIGPLATNMVLSLFFIVLTHDAGHAFTVKFFGREVLGIGIGWNWFSPILYVDTSDMWLAPPLKRIAVHLAGLYVNLFLAGLTSLISLFFWKETALLFALLSYLVVTINLIPLFQSDGQYALKDLLEYRGIRRHSHSKALRP